MEEVNIIFRICITHFSNISMKHKFASSMWIVCQVDTSNITSLEWTEPCCYENDNWEEVEQIKLLLFQQDLIKEIRLT